MSAITSMLMKNQRMFQNSGITTQIFTLKNKMRYNKFLLQDEVEKIAKENGIEIEDDTFRSGSLFLKNNETIIGIYDVVTQTLFSNVEI